MLDWLRRNQTKKDRLLQSLADFAKELGVLLIAFGPLDAAIGAALEGKTPWKLWPYVVVFMVAGVVAFLAGLFVEWRVRK